MCLDANKTPNDLRALAALIDAYREDKDVPLEELPNNAWAEHLIKKCFMHLHGVVHEVDYRPAEGVMKCEIDWDALVHSFL